MTPEELNSRTRVRCVEQMQETERPIALFHAGQHIGRLEARLDLDDWDFISMLSEHVRPIAEQLCRDAGRKYRFEHLSTCTLLVHVGPR